MKEIITISANLWLVGAILLVAVVWKVAPIFYRGSDKSAIETASPRRLSRTSKRSRCRNR